MAPRDPARFWKPEVSSKDGVGVGTDRIVGDRAVIQVTLLKRPEAGSYDDRFLKALPVST
jgi:hypothetical protein